MTAPQRPEPLHQDPDPRYVAGPETVRAMRNRETAAEARSGVGAFAWMLVAIALVAILALLVVAPRGVPDPTVVPGSNAPGTGDRQGLPGAPLERQPGPSGTPDRHDSGALLAAGPRWAGSATWYCGRGSRCTRGYSPGELVAAIDTDLGIPKGSRVIVRAFGRSVTVGIVDVCACAGERLIDLTSGAFRRLAPLEAGVIPVTIEVASRVPRGTLPPTDAETDR